MGGGGGRGQREDAGNIRGERGRRKSGEKKDKGKEDERNMLAL